MNPRLVTCAALVAVAGLLVAPAGAAAKKRKVLRGSYHLTTSPNPGLELIQFAKGGCDQTVPLGADNHAFAVPAAGTLHVVLQGNDPTKGGAPLGAGPDWDLFILDSDDMEIDSSGSPGAFEETIDWFKQKQPITIQACNLTGVPDATVTWSFTYK